MKFFRLMNASRFFPYIPHTKYLCSLKIYQSIPSTGLDELYDLLGIFALAEGGATGEENDGTDMELDWPLLLAKMDREGKGELSKWLCRHGQRETDMESVGIQKIHPFHPFTHSFS